MTSRLRAPPHLGGYVAAFQISDFPTIGTIHKNAEELLYMLYCNSRMPKATCDICPMLNGQHKERKICGPKALPLCFEASQHVAPLFLRAHPPIRPELDFNTAVVSANDKHEL